MSKWLLASSMLIFLAGCTPQVTMTPAPSPTLEAVRVQVTPATKFLSQALHDCSMQDPAAGLVLEEIPASIMKPQAGLVAFRFGAPDSLPGFVSEVGQTQLKVIVHPSNSVSEIPVDDLKVIFAGQVKSWQQVVGRSQELSEKEIHTWSYLDGDDQRQVFEAWLGEKAGRGIYQAPTGEAMVEAVGKDPQAIGFVLTEWMGASVKEVKIEGDTNGLKQPILAMSAEEPQSAVRRLVACMQKSSN